MTDNLAARFAAAKAIVEDASSLALHHRSRSLNLDVWSKGDNDPVSAADLAVETLVRTHLNTLFPQDAIVGEENGGELQEQGTWALDPIDGTMNFLRGSPLWGISLGYVRNGVPLLGVVAMPALGMIVSGGEDMGLTIEGRSTVGSIRNTGTRVVSLGDSGHDDLDAIAALYLNLRRGGWFVECFHCTSLGLAFAATGVVDGHIQDTTTLWDATAGAALCRAAGLETTLARHPDGTTWMVRAGTKEVLSIA